MINKNNISVPLGEDFRIEFSDVLTQGHRTDTTLTLEGSNTLTVHGTVVGQYAIRALGDGNSIYISETGAVRSSGSYRSIELRDNYYGISSIANEGEISGDISTSGRAAIINGGTISGVWAGVGAQGGHLSIQNSGAITTRESESGNDGIVGIGINSSSWQGLSQLEVSNTGIIVGRDVGIGAFWNAKYAELRVINSGIIEGRLLAIDAAPLGDDVVDNIGMIIGSVYLHGGNDYFKNSRAGYVSGALFAGAGNDTLIGSSRYDKLYGGNGDDVLLASLGGDLLDGGLGSDTVSFEAISKPLSLTINANGSVEVVGLDDPIIITGFENVTGTAYEDEIIGNAGNNILDGGAGADTMAGGAGNDTLLGGGGHDNLFGGAGRDRLVGGAGRDQLTGGTGDDTLEGGAGNDILFGGNGRDVLIGGVGSDQLIGEAGKDRLTGGLGADHFIFTARTDSGAASVGRDVIIDFRRAQGDIIDLSAIDANPRAGDDQAFRFLGTNQFVGAAGELRYQHSNGNTLVFADTDGDGRADFSVELIGQLTLLEQDFLL